MLTRGPRSNDGQMIKAVSMGFSRKRIGRDGKPRYTAYYLDLRGQERSAGTFPNKKAADKAWQDEEAKVRAGKPGNPSRGKQTFEAYVMDKWLPHHLLEPGVRSNYASHIRNHLLPFFGSMKMRDIMPELVREWVTWMKGKDASAQTIKYSKGSVLNAIFTTALEDEVVTIHPSHGVKIPPAPEKPRRIITPAQFDRLYQALPDADAQLLVETDIESGLRWGELTEVRVRDIDFATCILTVSRAVVELTAEDHPDGGRFLVKDYPKDKEYRRFKLSQQITAKIHAHVAAKGLGSDDLIFTYQPPTHNRTRRPDLAAAPLPGMTEPNELGRRYRHGTLTAYNAAKCRCDHCRGAYADYRARRRAGGETIPAPRGCATPTGTFPPTGSATRYGIPRGKRQGSQASGFMTSGMRMPPGFSPEARTCRSSGSGWATRASPRRRSTCTAWTKPTRPRSRP
jgi:integrase